MDGRSLARLKRELEAFVGELLADVPRRDQRAWALAYLRGLLLDGDRKSVGPMAERLAAVDHEPAGDRRDYEQALQQFVGQSPWPADAVRDRLQRWLAARGRRRAGSRVGNGNARKLSGRFAAWRVRPAHRLSDGRGPQDECWLLAEWPAGEPAPTKYFLSNLPATTSLRRLVRAAKGRWWVEQSYREMKDELGLDHYEGRSWAGWHHHVALVMLAYAFVVARRRQKGGGATARGSASRRPAA